MTAPESFGESYDAAFVSASPLALTEALLLARAGKRVVVFDRRDAIGGAWRAEDALGYRDVEVGCHIFISNPKVWTMLTELWGVTLKRMEPAPRLNLHWRGRLIAGPLGSPGVRSVQSGLEVLARGKGWAVGRREPGNLRKAARAVGRSFSYGTAWLRGLSAAPKVFHYPTHGTGEMVRALLERIEEAGVTLRLGTTVAAVDLANGGASLKLDDGSAVAVGQLVLTRGSSIDALNGATAPPRPRMRRHWVAVIDDPAPRGFSYLVFDGHPAIRRVSDVTGFARTMAGDPVEPGRKILCFYVRNQLLEQGREAAEARLLALMKRRGWIGANARVIRSEWWEDVETARDYRPLAPILQRSPAIRMISHINLGGFLRDNAHRYLDPGGAVEPAGDAARAEPDGETEDVSVFD